MKTCFKDLWFVVAMVVLLTGVSAFAGQPVKLVSCEWAPYGSEKIQGNGFACEIIKEAFKRSGYDAEFVFQPWARAMKDAEDGKYDGLFNAYLNEERGQKFHPSDPYADSVLLICSRSDFPKTSYASVKELSEYKIGLVKGYANSPEIDNADYLTKDFAYDDQMNLSKLLNNRVDLIVIDKFTALSDIKENKYSGASSSSIKFLTPPVDTKPVYILFTRKKDDIQKIIDAFNKGLSEIKADGAIDKIMEKNGFLVD